MLLLQSYTNARSFIVTHYPTQEGAVNFLRMLIDHGSNTVVCVDPLRNINTVCKKNGKTNLNNYQSYNCKHRNARIFTYLYISTSENV